MIDTDRLKDAVKHFKFYSRPSNASSGSVCTIKDINNLIEHTVDVLEEFISEIERSQDNNS